MIPSPGPGSKAASRSFCTAKDKNVFLWICCGLYAIYIHRNAFILPNFPPSVKTHTMFPVPELQRYNIIEEASRERFICACKEAGSYSTVDFVKRAITCFGHAPDTIQTDNDRKSPIHKRQ